MENKVLTQNNPDIYSLSLIVLYRTELDVLCCTNQLNDHKYRTYNYGHAYNNYLYNLPTIYTVYIHELYKIYNEF